MRLSRGHGPRGEIDYRIDAGDGQLLQGRMRASVALEIARRAETLRESGVEGFEIVADGRYLFPAEEFEIEDWEFPRK